MVLMRHQLIETSELLFDEFDIWISCIKNFLNNEKVLKSRGFQQDPMNTKFLNECQMAKKHITKLLYIIPETKLDSSLEVLESKRITLKRLNKELKNSGNKSVGTLVNITLSFFNDIKRIILRLIR